VTTEQTSEDTTNSPPPQKPQGNAWRTFGIIVITMVVTLGISYWVVSYYLFPSGFKPVVLNQQQQQTLDEKIQRLGGGMISGSSQQLAPEAYSEDSAPREIEFTERELNALLAKNTDFAEKLAIDLSNDLVSANLLVDVDPDFPVVGGQTIKVTGGMEMRLADGQPSVSLKGISIWGVPLPNAWLGNLKNIDFVKQYGESGGLWQTFNDGVEEIVIEDGRVLFKLKE